MTEPSATAGMRSAELDQLATALCAAQAEFVAIPKDSTNPFFKSRYAGLPKVVEVASPILTKHGLTVSQFIGQDGQGGDTLTTWLLHKSGQFISQAMRLHLVKDDPQGQGSAVTYARRYSYMAVLGLVGEEDDDGNRASLRRPGRLEVHPVRRPEGSPKAAGGDGTAKEALATSEDVTTLRNAAKGLSLGQAKLAFTEVGLPLPDPFHPDTCFAKVPQSRTALLAEKLSAVKR